MDADLIRAVFALACIGAAANALVALARGKFTDLTAISVAAAGAVWCVLVGAPRIAAITGFVLAVAFLIIDARTEQTEVEELMS